nr:MAG TPA: tail tape measure protein [Bacteriophage sp.]
MPSQRTDASVAFSVTDNLSQSIVGMKNSVNSFKQDVTGLQQQLDKLDSTRFQLKNFDLKNARQELDRTKKALQELGDTATEADREAARADFERANQNYENVRRQLNLVSKQARQTERDLLDATDAISKADNRAGSSVGGVLSALGKAGLMDMAGDVALDFGNLVVGSTFGSEVGGVVSSGISGALSGAAMGSLLGPVGTAVGAAIGGGLGLLQGGSQAAQGRDDAFKQYYSDLYDTQQAAAEESLSAGGDTASQRELDAIAFNRLLGQGVGDQYLEDLRTLAADTPMEYGDLTSMSRALATGFGDAPDRMLELMTAIGDAGSAVGVTASDMEIMAQAMSRMNSSGKATLEYLNIFQDRGVDVIGMLADAMGKTQGEIYDMISGGDINGQEAVNIIQAGMESMYGGAMETMAQTFDGLTSTLEDAMTEIDNAMGEGYNERAKEGLQADIDAYGGALGDALAQANEIIGEGKAIAENLDRQYSREALSALTLGTSTTVYGEDQANRLAEMHDQYTSLVDQYQNATEEDKAVIASQIEALKEEAQAMADSAYDASEMSQELHDVNLDLITAIRENTAALGSAAWGKDYEVEQEKTKGTGSTLLDTVSSAISKANSFVGQNAWGLDRVPYDNYLTYLHEGERVLTASQARAMDQGGSAPNVSVTVSGNTFGAGMDETAVAEAIADTAVRKILAGYRG